MPEFRYEAMTPGGKIRKGEITAADQAVAMRSIEALDLTVIRIAPAGSRASGPNLLGSLFSRGLPAEETSRLLSDLAALTGASLRIDEAIELMLHEIGGGRAAALLSDLLQRLAGGDSLSKAMAAHPEQFSELEIEMLHLAEASGEISAALRQIVEDRERQRHVEQQVSNSLRYPALLFLGAIAIMIFFMVRIIPQFEAAIPRQQAETSALGTIFEVSAFLRRHSDALMIGALLLLAGGFLLSRQAGAGAWFRSLLRRIPVVRPVATAFRNARFCLLLAQTQRAGIELTTALGIIGPAVDGPNERAIGELSVRGLREGRKLADVLEEHAGLQELALRMIRVGEESSQIGALAERAGRLYQERAERQLSRLVGFVGPASLIVISTLIGGMIVMIMNALLSINALVGI